MNFNPTEKEIDFINQALTKFNDEKVGPDNHELLNIVEYDENKNIIGGILGGTYWGWMHIDILWVDIRLSFSSCRYHVLAGSRLL